MTTIHDKINSNLEVKEDTTLHGMIVGNVNVQEESKFFLHGMVIGNISVDEGCQIVIHGTVNGNISTNGKCEIFGTVNGKVIKVSGELVIDPNAKINAI